MRSLILMAIVIGLVAAGAIGFLVAVLVDENESTPLPTELVLPTPERTEIPAALATTSPDTPISETYGPGIVGRQRYRDRRFDDLSCADAWSQGEALAYPRGSGEPFETAADVTGDGTPERVRSVLISMSSYVVAVQDENGAFLFCDAGDRSVLMPLPDGTGFLESLELTGDNAHCCPEADMRVAYEWSGQSFVPSWSMVRELADRDSNPKFPASWECLFGPCPEVPPFVSAGATNNAASGEEELTNCSRRCRDLGGVANE